MLRNITIALLLLTSLNGISQSCDTSLLDIREVRASDTDPAISWEFNKHFVYFNPNCTPKNKLLIYMVGTFGNPTLDQLFPSLAANNGFHVISLKYPNGTLAATVCSNAPDTNCYKYFRHETLYGEDVSSGITVDTTNSILNRATKLVEYLNTTYPTENWNQFLSGNTIDWPKVITAGHSQGSGHAAYMGNQFPLDRVLMFAGPNEHSILYNNQAEWLNDLKATADSSYYAFGNVNDEISNISNQMASWTDLGLIAYGDSFNVDMTNCPYNNSHTLYTSQLFTGAASVNHGSVVADTHTPIGTNGLPEFTPVWEYMLGLCPVPTALIETENDLTSKIYPNPVRDQLMLKVNTPVKYALYNSLGVVLKRENNMQENQLVINTSNLTSGIYFIQLTAKEKTVIKKFIKQ